MQKCRNAEMLIHFHRGSYGQKDGAGGKFGEKNWEKRALKQIFFES